LGFHPYFIFSEHCKDFYYNGDYITSKKFRNCVKEIENNKWEIIVIPEYYPEFNKESKEKISESKEKESIIKFSENYENIQNYKKLNRIVYIK
jgi:hypothetical protein